MLKIERVTRRFGAFAALREVSLNIEAGKSVALWGANGAGKSTLIRCVLGLDRFEGSISIAGLDSRTHAKESRRRIGYVPQELGFNDDMRVGEAIRFYAGLRGIADPDAARSLARVGLAGQESKRMRHLSGGMKQRLALALALLGDPPLLVLDEVTASLDAGGREEFVALLAALARDGRSMLFASHRQDEVQRLADQVAVLDRGRLASLCTPEQLLGPPILKLRLDGALRDRALRVLTARGFDATPNGVGILVRIARGAVGAPIHALADDGVRVEDFELTHHAPPQGTPAGSPGTPQAGKDGPGHA